MGFSLKKANKAFDNTSFMVKDSGRVSYGTMGRNERKAVEQVEQSIEGYDYNPADHSNKGSLRREKRLEEARKINDDSKLSDEQKKFQLQRMIDEERIHQKKFEPDKQRKQYLRDNLLNKNEDLDRRFDKYTDGNYRTKT